MTCVEVAEVSHVGCPFVSVCACVRVCAAHVQAWPCV